MRDQVKGQGVLWFEYGTFPPHGFMSFVFGPQLVVLFFEVVEIALVRPGWRN